MNNITNMKIFADVALMGLSRSHCRFERMALCSVHDHWWWINFKIFLEKIKSPRNSRNAIKNRLWRPTFFMFFFFFRHLCTVMSQWYENQKKCPPNRNLFKNSICSRFWNFWINLLRLEVERFPLFCKNAQLPTPRTLFKSSKIN